MPQIYLLDLIIFPKKKKLNWEGDITGLLEVNVNGSCLIEIDDSREAFGFATDVMVSTKKGCTIVNKFIVIVLKCIMTHSFILLEVDDEDTVSTFCALQFSTYISPSAAVSTISDMTQNSASNISIGSDHFS